MILRYIQPDFAVTSQIKPDDIAGLADRGVVLVVNNRSDNEDPDQPTSLEIRAACSEAGVHYQQLPIEFGQFSEQGICDFLEAMDSLEGTVVAFCEFGTRSVVLWALSQAGMKPLEEILRTCRDADFDLTGVEPLIQERAERVRLSRSDAGPRAA